MEHRNIFRINTNQEVKGFKFTESNRRSGNTFQMRTGFITTCWEFSPVNCTSSTCTKSTTVRLFQLHDIHLTGPDITKTAFRNTILININRRLLQEIKPFEKIINSIKCRNGTPKGFIVNIHSLFDDHIDKLFLSFRIFRIINLLIVSIFFITINFKSIKENNFFFFITLKCFHVINNLLINRSFHHLLKRRRSCSIDNTQKIFLHFDVMLYERISIFIINNISIFICLRNIGHLFIRKNFRNNRFITTTSCNLLSRAKLRSLNYIDLDYHVRESGITLFPFLIIIDHLRATL